MDGGPTERPGGAALSGVGVGGPGGFDPKTLPSAVAMREEFVFDVWSVARGPEAAHVPGRGIEPPTRAARKWWLRAAAALGLCTLNA